MRNNGHYAVQGHSGPTISVKIESPFVLPNRDYTNLHPILHRFRDRPTAHYWSKLRSRQTVPVFNTLITHLFWMNR